MGKPKIRPPQIATSDPIEIKFVTVDYVVEMTLHVKFSANLPKGSF